MAIEFRDRKWIDEIHINDTMQWFRQLRRDESCIANNVSVCIIASDELRHETYPNIRCDNPNEILPIVLIPSVNNAYAYIRIHRRNGTNKLLSAKELDDWVNRIDNLLNSTSNNETSCKFNGLVYILWGTDHEDQPIQNVSNLRKLWNNRISDTSISKNISKCSSPVQDDINGNNNKNNNDNLNSSHQRINSKILSPSSTQIHSIFNIKKRKITNTDSIVLDAEYTKAVYVDNHSSGEGLCNSTHMDIKNEGNANIDIEEHATKALIDSSYAKECLNDDKIISTNNHYGSTFSTLTNSTNSISQVNVDSKPLQKGKITSFFKPCK
jgi:hypothetical protein